MSYGTGARESTASSWQAGLERALLGLPPRVLKAASVASEALRAVVCEVGRGPQLWMESGKSVVLAGEFSDQDLGRALQAMSPWEEDGTSGVDGELHFRMTLGPHAAPRGIVVYLHRHRRLECPGLEVAVRKALAEERAGVLVFGTPEAQENALREIASVASVSLGISTALVDPGGRVGGRGRIPHRSIGGAAWIRVHEPSDVLRTCETLLMHARPRVLVTALDAVEKVQEILPRTGHTLLVLGTPVPKIDPPQAEIVQLASQWALAAAVAEEARMDLVPDLRRAVVKSSRR
jgi:hypothetical protein